ncbi:hypothetical protein C8Q70DRAFT_168164 [Cubamyces menziesii]|nr:hypothetical protein C8Q70DRAFT_168164 [Cubamyces menziesii]
MYTMSTRNLILPLRLRGSSIIRYPNLYALWSLVIDSKLPPQATAGWMAVTIPRIAPEANIIQEYSLRWQVVYPDDACTHLISRARSIYGEGLQPLRHDAALGNCPTRWAVPTCTTPSRLTHRLCVPETRSYGVGLRRMSNATHAASHLATSVGEHFVVFVNSRLGGEYLLISSETNGRVGRILPRTEAWLKDSSVWHLSCHQNVKPRRRMDLTGLKRNPSTRMRDGPHGGRSCHQFTESICGHLLDGLRLWCQVRIHRVHRTFSPTQWSIRCMPSFDDGLCTAA